ncbi:MAG TPA: WD40 repeat domain-containing protein, partial [Gemmataceae bacterium]|nr:WD40 repeat domain-containing protein [Gemmataceae bacterium]
LTFSADGKTLISVGADQNILVWDATSRAAAVKPAKADGKILERCWTDLGHDDPSIAFQAMGNMIDLPAEAVALLDKKLLPVPPVETAVIDKLIGELDSESFAVREKASKDLVKLEGQARQALEAALAKPPSAEVQSRAKKLLEGLDAPLLAPAELRIVRAVEALERIGTAEARALLARLAKGAPGARLTVEAHAAHARLTN